MALQQAQLKEDQQLTVNSHTGHAGFKGRDVMG